MRVNADVTERHLAVALAGSAILAMNNVGLCATVFGVDDRPHDEIRLAMQAALDEGWIAPVHNAGICGLVLVERANAIMTGAEPKRGEAPA